MKHWQLAIVGVVAVMLGACAQKQQQPSPTPDYAQEPYQPYEPMAELDTPPSDATDPYAGDLIAPEPRTRTASATKAETPPPKKTATETTTWTSAEVRTHIVQKGDSFYKLAREYYGDQGRWRDIWYANQTRVPDPDTLPIGTKLIIP